MFKVIVKNFRPAPRQREHFARAISAITKAIPVY